MGGDLNLKKCKPFFLPLKALSRLTLLDSMAPRAHEKSAASGTYLAIALVFSEEHS